MVLLLFFSSLGFISIDCGLPVNFNFVDVDTGISYTPDGAYVSTGINNNISSSMLTQTIQI
ncbi:hypothetical protein Gohar_002387 [Gossypium harknessii]|uniref:Malectin-like domain-containing protein n=1 Tax=Gossypium harknessii TaxID=34285 RepID=A0A7J9HLV8_9ROSI|nr:hypothetical protein [Gossypium harknessii]